MNKSIRIVFLSGLIICMLAMPVMANYNYDGWSVNTRVTGSVNGGVFHDSIGWDGNTTRTLETDVPNGTVKYAYLYTGIWGGHGTGWVNVTFNGDCTSNKLGPIHLEYENDVNDNVWCTGYGKYWLWYNVTNLVNTGQINTATTSKINGDIHGNVYGIVLVVVYEGGDDPKQIQYWINDGSDALNVGNPEGTTSFTGTVNTDNIAMANLTMVHLTGYDPSCSNCTKFNDNELDTSCVNTDTFDMHSWNVTNYMEASGNDACFSLDPDDYVNICNAILTVEYEPDLIVTSITTNCDGYLFGNESNTVSAVIENIGAGNAGVSNASFMLSGGYSETVAVPALNVGKNTTVSITDPTIRNASDSVTITVTADCNTEVSESNETNNVTDLGPITVVNNGYKGKTYTGGPNMTTWKTYDLNGNLVYSAGDSYYLSAYYNPHWTTYNITWTAGNLSVPGTAAIKEARLYVPYTSDKASVMPNEVSLNFNGMAQTLDAHYSDRKGYDGYDNPYGMLTYNVTSNFSTAGNIANLTNNHLGGANVSIRGMMLVAIYEDANEPQRQIFVNEEFDLLYGGSN